MREDIGGEGTLSSSSSSVGSIIGSHDEVQVLAKSAPTCNPDRGGGVTQVKTRISDARERYLPRPVTIVAVSDPHNLHDSIGPMPSGDILIHGGNLTNAGTEEELTEAFNWLQPIPGFEYKKWIGGNLGRILMSKVKQEEFHEKFPSLTYLQVKTVVTNVRGRKLRTYGPAGTLKLGFSSAFQHTVIAEEQAKIIGYGVEYHKAHIL